MKQTYFLDRWSNGMNNLIKYGCFLSFKRSPLKKCFVDNAGSDRSVLFKSLIFHETLQKNIMIFLFTEVYRVPFDDSTKQMLARIISFLPFYKCWKFGYVIRISNLIYIPAVCLWVISAWLDGTQHELAPEKKNSHALGKWWQMKLSFNINLFLKSVESRKLETP